MDSSVLLELHLPQYVLMDQSLLIRVGCSISVMRQAFPLLMPVLIQNYAMEPLRKRFAIYVHPDFTVKPVLLLIVHLVRTVVLHLMLLANP